jgi:ABC-type glycerol-3-phosphate transport system substrate-binding protein
MSHRALGRIVPSSVAVILVAVVIVAGCGDSRSRLRTDPPTGDPSPVAQPSVAGTGTDASPAGTPSDGTEGSPDAQGSPDATGSPDALPTGDASGSPAGPVETPTSPPLSGTLLVWTFAQGDDEVPIKAYLDAFEQAHPGLETKLTVVPEDNYTTKINTSLQAHDPPDVAIIEDMRWAKSGRVVELTPHLERWGIDAADFAAGGMGRMALESDPAKGIYGVGDFLGGFVMVYNKALFDQAGVPYPPIDRSLTYQEYDAMCRALTVPGADPSQTIFGCASHDNAYSLDGEQVFGADGRTIIGNGNSPAMVEAFNIGTALIRDRMAPSGSVMDALGGESDLFAQGKIAITGTDFTEVDKFRANGIDFGLAPFYVVQEGRNVVDTFTAPWGTFTEAGNPEAGLEFIRFIATEAQRIRPQLTPDPPLSIPIAQEISYGEDDPIKQEYLEVLQLAGPPVFLPPGLEAWDPGEVVRKMTIEGQTDAKPILDAMVAVSQPELDRVWREWDELHP